MSYDGVLYCAEQAHTWILRASSNPGREGATSARGCATISSSRPGDRIATHFSAFQNFCELSQRETGAAANLAAAKSNTTRHQERAAGAQPRTWLPNTLGPRTHTMVSSSTARLGLVLVLCGILTAGTAHALPAGWERLQSVSPSAEAAAGMSLRVLIGVRQRNVAALEELFQRVSDPDDVKVRCACVHPGCEEACRRRAELALLGAPPCVMQYGQYLTHEELAKLTAPLLRHVEAAEVFLASLGASGIARSTFGDFVSGTVSLRNVARAFPHAQFARYRHIRTSTEVVRATKRIALPPHIESAVDVVSGLWDVPLIPDNLRQVGGATPKRAMTAAPQGDGGDPILQVFCTSGNEVVVSIVSLQCAGVCAEDNSVARVNVSAAPKSGGASLVNSYPPNSTYCRPDPQDDQVLICLLTTPHATNYEPYTITVDVLTSDGSTVRRCKWRVTCDVSVMCGVMSAVPMLLLVALFCLQFSSTFATAIAPRPYTLPTTVHDLYNVPKSELSAMKKGQDGVILWGGEYYSPKVCPSLGL